MSVTYQTKDANNGNWYYVTYKVNGVSYKGFVPAGKVTITKVGKITNASKVNVRKSYSTKSKVLTTLKRNQTVTVLSTKTKKGTKWYKVTFKKKKKPIPVGFPHLTLKSSKIRLTFQFISATIYLYFESR